MPYNEGSETGDAVYIGYLHQRCGHDSGAIEKHTCFSFPGFGEVDIPNKYAGRRNTGMEFLSDIGVSCSKNAKHPILEEMRFAAPH